MVRSYDDVWDNLNEMSLHLRKLEEAVSQVRRHHALATAHLLRITDVENGIESQLSLLRKKWGS